MAKTAAQWQDLADKAQAEIEEVLSNGQSLTEDGQSLERAPLDSLIRLQKYYQSQADSAAKGNRRVAEFTS